MGWVPEEEFRGDKSKWIDADRFIERGENELPILRERYKKLDERNGALEGEMREMKETLRQFAEHHKKVSEREYAKAKRDLERQRDEAISLADPKKVKEIEADMQELEAMKPPAAKADDKAGAGDARRINADDQKHFEAWEKSPENRWFKDDPELRAYACSIANYLQQTKPHLFGTAEFYPSVAEEVRTRFPGKFTNPRRDEPGTVHGTQTAAGGGKKGKGYNDLPAEAKKACDKFVKTIPGYTRDQYCKEYFSDEE